LLRSALGDLALFSASNEEITPVWKGKVAFSFETWRIVIMWSRKTKMQKESGSKTLRNEEDSAPFRSVSKLTCPYTTFCFDRVRQLREIYSGKLSSILFDLKCFIQGLLISLTVPGSSQKFFVGNI